MPNVTAPLPSPDHRARMVTEAVVSAYIQEIAPPRPARATAAIRRACSPQRRAIAHPSLAGREVGRSLARPRRTAATPIHA